MMSEIVKEEEEGKEEQQEKVEAWLAVSVAGSRHLVTRVPAVNPRLLGGSMVQRPAPPSWKSPSVAHYTRRLPHQAATSSGRQEPL